MSISFDFRGKTAIVTGSARGIGREIALSLGKGKANVVVNYNSSSSSDKAEEVVKLIRGYGGNAVSIQGNIGDLTAHDKIINSALVFNGAIDIIIHNAGCGDDALLTNIDQDLYDRIYNTNVKGPIFFTQRAIKYLSKGSRIVFVSSAAARIGVEECTVYGSSKAAIENIIKVWSKELGQKYDCTVNAVNPGPVKTDQLYESSAENLEYLTGLAKETPAANRLGETSDIAPLVLFLCTESARWSSGSVLNANGGVCPV